MTILILHLHNVILPSEQCMVTGVIEMVSTKGGRVSVACKYGTVVY